MTTKEFSSIALPYPKYHVEVGCFEVGHQDNDAFLPQVIPSFCYNIQLVEVKKSTLNLSHKISPLEDLIGSCVCIENANLELFIRRDFIKSFVLTGKVYLWHDQGASIESSGSYKISCTNNVMVILMDEHQYARFGLIGKRLNKKRGKRQKTLYQVEVDLREEKILKSNKYQDRLLACFKRLPNINKLYFRWSPCNNSCISTDIDLEANNRKAMEFFESIIDEYNKYSFTPLPLTGCIELRQKLERKWTNRSQLYPFIDGPNNLFTCYTEPIEGVERDADKLAAIVDVVDWLGQQFLSLNCIDDVIMKDGKNIDSTGGASGRERVDVSCSQLTGPMDFDWIQRNLGKIFGCPKPKDKSGDDNEIILRALILHDHIRASTNITNKGSFSEMSSTHGSTNTCVVLMQLPHLEQPPEPPVTVPDSVASRPTQNNRKKRAKVGPKDSNLETRSKIVTIKMYNS